MRRRRRTLVLIATLALASWIGWLLLVDAAVVAADGPQSPPPNVAAAREPLVLFERAPTVEPLSIDESPVLARGARGWVMPWPPALRPPPLALQPDGVTLIGRVVDALAAPVAGAEVLFYSDAFGSHGERYPDVHGETSTDAEGRFALAHDGRSGTLPSRHGWPAAAWLVVRAPGHPPAVRRVTHAPGSSELRLPEVERLRGRLRFDDDTPMAYAELRVDDQVTFLRRSTRRHVEVSRVLGQSDAQGGFDVPVDSDWRELTLTLVHPEYGGSVDVRRAELSGLLQLVLPRGASLTLEPRGDLAGWSASRCDPTLTLLPLILQEDGSLGPNYYRSSGQAPDPARELFKETLRFERIAEAQQRVVLRWTGGPRMGQVLVERWERAPGAHRLVVDLPPAPARDSGVLIARVPDREGSFELALLDRAGSPWPAALPEYAGCRLELSLSVHGSSGDPRSLRLEPGGFPHRVSMGSRPAPYRVEFAGSSGFALVRDVLPGEQAVARLDPAELIASHGSLWIDTAGLPPELPLHDLRISAYGEDFNARHRDAGPGPHLLPAGRWRVAVKLPGVLADSTVLDIASGQTSYVEARARPAAPADKAVLRGRLDVLADDPWLVPGPLLVTRLGDTRTPVVAHPLGVAHLPRSYRLELEPGRYELELRPARVFGPERPGAWGADRDAWQAWPGAMGFVPGASRVVEVKLLAGELRELDLVLDASALRTVVLLQDQQPADTYASRLHWRAAGQASVPGGALRYCRGWPTTGLSYSFPPGRWELALDGEWHRFEVLQGEGPQFIELGDATRLDTAAAGGESPDAEVPAR